MPILPSSPTPAHRLIPIPATILTLRLPLFNRLPAAPFLRPRPGTISTGVLNTYYPGTASVAAGATSIPVGAATGAGSAIAAGNLLLVIQMQDASINDTNTVAYGNGYTGQGFTALNSAGDYEFVTAQTRFPQPAARLPSQAPAPVVDLSSLITPPRGQPHAGQSTYQVIVVPQYTTASFNAPRPHALAWNGSTGGVLVLDTSRRLR